MTPEEIEDAATQLVVEHLDEGIEYLTVSEALFEEHEEVSEEDTKAVFDKANRILTKIIDMYFEDAD